MKCIPLTQWEIAARWGKLSLTSWGNPSGTPVFLAHGRQDCSATFQPLLELLPGEEFYYVAIDMPGSGKSDPLPRGVKIMRFHFLAAMECALEHLAWDQFIFIGHSMGCEVGLFYNVIHPGKMTKMILLDAEPTLRRLQVNDPAEYQSLFYDDYYNNYEKENYTFKTYTIEEAKQAIMKSRHLTEEKATIIVDKSLIHVADDKYRFTWDRRLRLLAPQNYTNQYYFALFKNIPPTLFLSASNSIKPLENNSKLKNWQNGSLELISMMEELRNFYHVVVEGDHDVHLSTPEMVAPYVIEFMINNNVLKSKL